jgi:hypothetical protein
MGRISLLDMVASLPHNVQRRLNPSLDVCEQIKHDSANVGVSLLTLPVQMIHRIFDAFDATSESIVTNTDNQHRLHFTSISKPEILLDFSLPFIEKMSPM